MIKLKALNSTLYNFVIQSDIFGIYNGYVYNDAKQEYPTEEEINLMRRSIW